MPLTSYRDIYKELSQYPSLKINSPQTVKNICDRALNKLKNSLPDKKKKELVELLSILNDISEGNTTSVSRDISKYFF